MCRSTLIEPRRTLKILKMCKTTSMEDDLNVRWPQKLEISGNEQKCIQNSVVGLLKQSSNIFVEYLNIWNDLTQNLWKNGSIKNDLNSWKYGKVYLVSQTSKVAPELGSAPACSLILLQTDTKLLYLQSSYFRRRGGEDA